MKLKKVTKTALVIGVIFGFMFSLLMMNFSASESSAAEPIVLSVAPSSVPPPPAGSLTTVFTDQMNLLEKRSNGRLKIEIYWGQSLASAKDLVTACSTGVCDIAMVGPHYEPGKIPLSAVSYQPGIGTHNFPRAQAYWDLLNQDILRSELGKFGLRPIGLFLIADTALMCRIPVRTVADLKGKRIASRGVQSETFSLLGAVPMAMAPPEMYDGLKKGILDAVACPAAAAVDFKLYEGGKYFATWQFGPQVQPEVIREKSWEKLPADIQKVIIDSAPDLIKIAYEDFMLGEEAVMKVFKDYNVEILEISDAELAAVRKVQSGQGDKWAEELESKGLPAKKLLAEYRALVEKYEKTNPYK